MSQATSEVVSKKLKENRTVRRAYCCSTKARGESQTWDSSYIPKGCRYNKLEVEWIDIISIMKTGGDSSRLGHRSSIFLSFVDVHECPKNFIFGIKPEPVSTMDPDR